MSGIAAGQRFEAGSVAWSLLSLSPFAIAVIADIKRRRRSLKNEEMAKPTLEEGNLFP